ncbi:cytochrome P450 [Xylaria flabelliformis]|nr:cytochrome P450 [Xylaria flabelliformis]
MASPIAQQSLATTDTMGLSLGPIFTHVIVWEAPAILIMIALFALSIPERWHSSFMNPWSRLSSLISQVYTEILKRVRAWMYLFNGPGIIQHGFDISNGRAYEVHAPDNRYVFVSSEEHVRELDQAPDTVLSLQAASKQMLQPVYTMHGFNWFDRRGTEGVGFVRALRTLLTNNLPQILPKLGVFIRTTFLQMHAGHRIVNGERHSPVYPTIVKLVVVSNALSFFGEDLATNGDFLASALNYVEETLMCAEIVKLLPKGIAHILGPLIARHLTCQQVLYNALIPIATERCNERDRKHLGQTVPKHADCIQWIMETAPRQKPWTPERIVHERIAIWFGSVHALSTTITFAIQDLCLHPEYIETLRKENESLYIEFEQTGQGLPLLDSFIKESARLTPVESMSVRRAATQPFMFSDGTKLAIGDWACTPVRAIMQSEKYYPQPLEFNGFRFVKPHDLSRVSDRKFAILQPKPSKLVDVNLTWHVWGIGRMACPGRYYATAVMKVIISQLIMHYDTKLVDADAGRWFTWRSTMLPKKDTMVIFTPRTNMATI